MLHVAATPIATRGYPIRRSGGSERARDAILGRVPAPTSAPVPRRTADAADAGPVLVLASTSPRRRVLLGDAGVPVEVRPADVDETQRAGETPAETAARLARAKACAVAGRLSGPRRLVLGADTVVVLGETLFGKPRDAKHSIERLTQLAGRTHRVITAVAIAESGGDRIWQCSVTSRVTLRALSRDEIERYVALGESLDKAGGYALQGAGGRLVEHVEGSHSNVVGLPIAETLALLEHARSGRMPA